MALGEALAVRPKNGREMRELRRRPSQSFVKSDLLGSVGQVVIAADDMGDFHQRVIDDHHVVVNRHPVRAGDDGIADYFAGKLHRPVHDVVKANRPLGNAQADGGRLTRSSALLSFSWIYYPALAGVNV